MTSHAHLGLLLRSAPRNDVGLFSCHCERSEAIRPVATVKPPKLLYRRYIGVFILLSVGLTLAGCGKKGMPQPPPGVPNTYPRVYPNA
jgi:hypothetical protein